MPHFKFTAVPQIFASFSAQCAADPSLKITTQPSLGLLERPYESDGDGETRGQWERFARYVGWLNERAGEGTCYKVLYLTRHGLGYHNVMHLKVGTEAWDNHWSHLDGDGEVTWSDAHLVQEGIDQAKALNLFWKDLISQGAPYPQTIYTSPLYRCLQTTSLIFSPLQPPTTTTTTTTTTNNTNPTSTSSSTSSSTPFTPIIKELLREQMTDHTCDRRSPLSHIRADFPDYLIEEGFTEQDQLWRADHWETMDEHIARKYRVLSGIFANDEGQFLSLTVHSYAIAVILTVCGADVYRVREGSSIAVLVKAERVEEKPVVEGAALAGY